MHKHIANKHTLIVRASIVSKLYSMSPYQTYLHSLDFYGLYNTTL